MLRTGDVSASFFFCQLVSFSRCMYVVTVHSFRSALTFAWPKTHHHYVKMLLTPTWNCVTTSTEIRHLVQVGMRIWKQPLTSIIMQCCSVLFSFLLCSAFKLSSVAADFCLQPNALSTEICNLLFECVNVKILIYFNFSRRPKTRLLNSSVFKSVSSII